MTLGDRMLGYRIEQELGEGGMGVVFKAVNDVLGQEVAVKVLDPMLAKNPEVRERFIQEARIQVGLRHPSIVQVLTAQVDQEPLALVMEYVDGMSIEQVLKRRGALEVPEALGIMSQVLAAVGYAHARGVVHRDLKPSNIMVTADGHAKVMDFGIAKVVGSAKLTRTGTTMGSAHYMSPEQVLGRKDIDHRTDIYSLGVTLFEIVTGHVPFEMERPDSTDSDFLVKQAHVQTQAPDPRTLNAAIPESVAHAILKALEKDPVKRFRDADAFASSLLPGKAELPPKEKAIGPVETRSDLAAHPEPKMQEEERSHVVTKTAQPEEEKPSETDDPQEVLQKPRHSSKPFRYVVAGVLAIGLVASGLSVRSCIRSSNAEGAFRNGEESARVGDSVKAANSFRDACDGGKMRGCTHLGLMYQRGAGVGQDANEAVRFHRMACDGGEMLGCARLGFMYLNGIGVERDTSEAMRLCRRACDAREMLGCTYLGLMYQSGSGVGQDVSEAVRLYRKACDGGEMLGCWNFGFMYESGFGVGQDVSEAVRLYRKACDGGEMVGCTYLGHMHQLGSGVGQDLSEAVRLYRKACDGGEMTGCTNMGLMYESGVGVEQDASEAAHLYQKACDGGDMMGCSSLGRSFFRGVGAGQDKAQAFRLFRKACDGGDMRGCGYLGYMYDTGDGVAQDKGEAVRLYLKACDGGAREACASAGYPDRDNDGVVDQDDRCPEVAGAMERAGCPLPRVEVTDKKVVIREMIFFYLGSAVLLPQSFDLLREVAKVLNEHPNIKQVRVDGHTDNTGNPSSNMRLSQKRAESVMNFLIREGVSANRLSAQGFGDTVPIGDSGTELGRAQNRRVEFTLLLKE